MDKSLGRSTGPGPVKWCRNCARKHPRREACKLFLRERISKADNKVRRWAA